MNARLILTAALMLAGAGVGTGIAQAQSGAIASAMAAGDVGEKVDGYLGFPKAPSPALKAEVDAINIKRRQVYTQAAQAKNVSIEEFATSTGCSSIAKLPAGRSYSVGGGVWAEKGAGAAQLPQVCG